MYTDNYNENNETNESKGTIVDKFNEYKGNDKMKIIIIGVLAIVLVVMLIMIFKGGGSSGGGYVINVYPEAINVRPGGTQNVSYEVRKDGNIIPNAVVRFTIDDEKVARVDNTNVIGVSYGKAMLTITYVDDSGKSTQSVKEVTVSDGSQGTAISNVTLPEGDLYMPLNGTYDIPLSIEPSNGYIESKKVTSSDSNVVMVDDTGKVTSIGEGGAVITIDINNGQFRKQLKVYVSNDIDMPKIVSGDVTITINSTSNTLAVGASSSLTYTVNPSNANVGKITWTSSDPNVVSVDSNGTITGIKEGTATITATASNGVTGSISIQVGAVVTDITILTPVINLVINQSEILSPTVVPDNAIDKTLTYTAVDPTIVSVITNADGSATITGLSVGVTTITVQSANGISKSVTVTVSNSSGGNDGGSSSERCYCNASGSCKWSSSSYQDYKDLQSRIPNPTACSIYSNNHKAACFKNSDGDYKWGAYGNSSGYSYVAGVTSMSSCKESKATEEGLTCAHIYKGEKGQCKITSSNSATIKSATSSNESVLKIISFDTYKINYECIEDNSKGNNSATIKVTTSTGKNISDTVACKNKSSISIVCTPTTPTKGVNVNCKVSGLSENNQLKNCSVNKGTVSKSGQTCVVNYDQAGTVTVTADTEFGSVSGTVTYKESSSSTTPTPKPTATPKTTPTTKKSNITCPSGQYYNGTKCVTCTKGYFCVGFSETIDTTREYGRVSCPIGKYQDQTGKTYCEQCKDNKTTSSRGATSSTQCH